MTAAPAIDESELKRWLASNKDKHPNLRDLESLLESRNVRLIEQARTIAWYQFTHGHMTVPEGWPK